MRAHTNADDREVLRFGLKQKTRARWAIAMLLGAAIAAAAFAVYWFSGGDLPRRPPRGALAFIAIAVIVPGFGIYALLRALASEGEKLARRHLG